jgi:hypothetical protein
MMNRSAYRLVVAAAWIMAGALFVVPVWDHWYYHGRFGVGTVTGPVGAITAYTVVPAPTPQLRSSAVTGSIPTERSASARPELVAAIQAAGFGAPVRADGRSRPSPAQPSPVNVARSRQEGAPSDKTQSVHPPAPRASIGSQKGRDDLSTGAPAGIPVGSIVAGIVARPSQNGSPSNQSAPLRTDPAPPPGAPETPAGQDREPTPPAEEPLRLALVPQRTSISPGELLPVAVRLEGSRQVTSVPFHLRFDPDILEYVGVRTGPVLGASSLQPIILASVNPNRPGDLAVGLSLVGAAGTLNGTGTILLLDFRALAPGMSDLVLERASVRGPTSEPLPADIAGSAVEVH